MLVLGIVGVLVVSFIIDSRVSASWMWCDVEVCDEGGYGCEIIGYIEGLNVVDAMDSIAEEWYLESTTDWENVDNVYMVMDEVEDLVSEIAGSEEMGILLAILDNMKNEITYYEGYSVDDLPIEGYPILHSFSNVHHIASPYHSARSNTYWLWTGVFEPVVIVEYTVDGIARGCKVIKCTATSIAYCETGCE